MISFITVSRHARLEAKSSPSQPESNYRFQNQENCVRVWYMSLGAATSGSQAKPHHPPALRPLSEGEGETPHGRPSTLDDGDGGGVEKGGYWSECAGRRRGGLGGGGENGMNSRQDRWWRSGAAATTAAIDAALVETAGTRCEHRGVRRDGHRPAPGRGRDRCRSDDSRSGGRGHSSGRGRDCPKLMAVDAAAARATTGETRRPSGVHPEKPYTDSSHRTQLRNKKARANAPRHQSVGPGALHSPSPLRSPPPSPRGSPPVYLYPANI